MTAEDGAVPARRRRRRIGDDEEEAGVDDQGLYSGEEVGVVESNWW